MFWRGPEVPEDLERIKKMMGKEKQKPNWLETGSEVPVLVATITTVSDEQDDAMWKKRREENKDENKEEKKEGESTQTDGLK